MFLCLDKLWRNGACGLEYTGSKVGVYDRRRGKCRWSVNAYRAKVEEVPKKSPKSGVKRIVWTNPRYPAQLCPAVSRSRTPNSLWTRTLADLFQSCFPSRFSGFTVCSSIMMQQMSKRQCVDAGSALITRRSSSLQGEDLITQRSAS